MKQIIARIGRQTTKTLKKSQPIVVLAGLLASVILSSMPAVRANALAQNLTPSPKVSFTFDDSLASDYTTAAPALAKYGLTGTSYVITGCVGMTTVPNTCAANQDASYMTWDQIAGLQNQYGWEIGSHTVTHPLLAAVDGRLTPAQVTAELANSKQALADHGYTANDFAAPYGDYDNYVLSEAAKYYDTFRGFADLGYNTWPYNPSLIVNEQVQGPVTVAQVEAYVDSAIANNQWLVLTFHDIRDSASTATQDYQYSTANLEAIAAYVKAKQDAGSIKSVNIRDGLVNGTNLMPNGTFNSGIADGWTTDDPTHITADGGNNGRYPDPTNSVLLTSSPTANAASRDGNSHLFSPQVSVTPGQTYVIKNYLNVLSGGEVDFYIDEYDANGNWINGQFQEGLAYGTGNAINVSDINFSYKASATAASARIQVIVPYGANVKAYYDNATWYNTAETNPVDTAPVVSNPAVSNITSTSATVTWTTDKVSDSQVAYGTTSAYGTSTTVDSTQTTTHSVTLTGLTAGQTYHYQVISKDTSGKTGTSASDLLFATVPTKTGDVNNDGTVDALDLSVVLSNWNKSGVTYAQGDLNNDGTVDALDLSIVLSNWSK